MHINGFVWAFVQSSSFRKQSYLLSLGLWSTFARDSSDILVYKSTSLPHSNGNSNCHHYNFLFFPSTMACTSVNECGTQDTRKAQSLAKAAWKEGTWPLVRIETANPLDAKQSVQDVLGIYDEPSHCNLDVKHAMKATPGGRAWRAGTRQKQDKHLPGVHLIQTIRSEFLRPPEGWGPGGTKIHVSKRQLLGRVTEPAGLFWRTKESSAAVSTRLIPQQVKPKRSSTKQP